MELGQRASQGPRYNGCAGNAQAAELDLSPWLSGAVRVSDKTARLLGARPVFLMSEIELDRLVYARARSWYSSRSRRLSSSRTTNELSYY